MKRFMGAGVLGIWMQSLLVATRLYRSGLYRAFGGKRALLERCLTVWQISYGPRDARCLQVAVGGNFMGNS